MSILYRTREEKGRGKSKFFKIFLRVPKSVGCRRCFSYYLYGQHGWLRRCRLSCNGGSVNAEKSEKRAEDHVRSCVCRSFFSCKNTHEKSDADQSAAFPGELSLKGSLTCESIISHVVKKATPTKASLFPVNPSHEGCGSICIVSRARKCGAGFCGISPVCFMKAFFTGLSSAANGGDGENPAGAAAFML